MISYLLSAMAAGALVLVWALAPLGLLFFLAETLRWHREAMRRVRRG